MDRAVRVVRPTVLQPCARRFGVRDWRQEAGRNRDRRKKRVAKEKGRHQTQGLPAGPILQCDLHGFTATEAEARALEILEAAGQHQPRPSRVEFIHGHHRGTALRNVRDATGREEVRTEQWRVATQFPEKRETPQARCTAG
jgi:hypothetical protein